jgi:hypothetical protein
MVKRFYLLFLLSVASLSAQEEEGRLYSAKGVDFVLVSNGLRVIYQIDGLKELPINKTDMIQTIEGGSLELKLYPSGVLIKVLENTSLVYNGDTLEIIYGRIRVKMPENEQKGLFIQARTILVYMSKGDMGFEFILDPDIPIDNEQRVLRIHTLSQKARLKFENIPELQIDEHEQVSINIFSKASLVERKPLDESSVDYWNKNNFKDGKPLVLPPQNVSVLPPEK